MDVLVRDGGRDEDGVLLERWCPQCDQQAFAQLADRHRELIERICRRELGRSADIDDVVQEVLITFADQAPTIRGAPGAWLRTVAVHRCLNHLRARQRRRQHEARAGAGMAQAPADEAGGEESLAACLAELDEADRQLLVQLFFLGLSQVEVARREQVSSLVIHRRLQRALAGLRQRFAHRGMRIGASALVLLLAGGDRALAATAGAAAASISATATGIAIGGVATLLALGVLLVAVRSGEEAGGSDGRAPAAVPVAGASATASPTADAAPAVRPPAGASAADADAVVQEAAARMPFNEGFVVVEVTRDEFRQLACADFFRRAVRLDACPSATLDVAAGPASPAVAVWRLAPRPGHVIVLLPVIGERFPAGYEVVFLQGAPGGRGSPSWIRSRQVVIDHPRRGRLLMVEEERLGHAGAPAAPADRRWSWYPVGHRWPPIAWLAVDGPVQVAEARWRELSADERAAIIDRRSPAGAAAAEQ